MREPTETVAPTRPHVQCRQIGAEDMDAVLRVLERGFPDQPRAYYERALQRLAEHETPPGYARYGYVLEVDGRMAGVVLTIISSMMVGDERRIRINVSSWYVDPEFRGYAPLMTSPLRRHKEATYLNITPAPHTWPMLEALGYQRFSGGGFFSLAALHRRAFSAKVRRVTPDLQAGDGLTDGEAEVLKAHARFGCISVVCEWKGRRYPFVFIPRTIKVKSVKVPYGQLMYCRDFESYVQLAGPLGRFLLRRGLLMVMSDANGPIPELIGRYVDWGTKFARGPNPPHLGDLAYTEWAMFTQPEIRGG